MISFKQVLLFLLLFALIAGCFKRTRISLNNNAGIRYDLVDVVTKNGHKNRLSNCLFHADSLSGTMQNGKSIVLANSEIYQVEVLTDYSVNETVFFVGTISLITATILIITFGFESH